MAESRFFPLGVVTSTRFSSRQEIESTQSIQSKLPVFPMKECPLDSVYVITPDRAPSRAHSVVHPPDAARSIVVIQKRSLTQFRSCVARRSGDIVAGSVPQEPFQHIAHCLCLRYRASPVAILRFRLFENMLRGSAGPRSLETIKTTSHKRMRPLERKGGEQRERESHRYIHRKEK